jgi:predicted GNAT family N-acyltransferase
VDPTLRVYQKADREACVHIFRSNMPRFFAPSEEAEFAEFLDTEADENYFVVENGGGGELLGCGGVFVAGGVAGLCWGMVDNTRHRQGIGTLLLRGRLEHLRTHHPQLKAVQLDTSGHSREFFARFGFQTTRVTPDGYGPGLDRYDMTLSKERLERLLSSQASSQFL